MKPTNFNVEQFLRKTFKEPLDKVSLQLYQKGVRADQVTILGLLGSALVAYLVAHGHLFIGGLLLALFAPLDAVDGALARLSAQRITSPTSIIPQDNPPAALSSWPRRPGTLVRSPAWNW